MRVLCCGYVRSGMTICGDIRFLGVFGIGFVVDSSLGSGVGFEGELALWFLCGEFLSASTLGPPLS